MANRLVKEEGGSYIQGNGVVQINGEKVVITMEDTGRTFTDLMKDDLPEGVVSGETYSIRLSADGTDLYSIRPIEASVVVRFEKFASQKDMPPMPKLQKGGPREWNGKKWNAPDKLVFTAVLKIVSKRYRGMEIPYIMDYTFRQWEDTNETAIPYGKKRQNQVLEFLKLFGWDDEEDNIPYSDNVLPFLEKLLKAKNTKVLASIKKGYIETISPYDDDLMG